MVAKFDDDRVIEYGNPYEDDRQKLWQAAEAVRSGGPLACGVEAASAHTRCTNGAQESGWPIAEFPEAIVRRQKMEEVEDTLVWVEGLQETLETAYAEGRLPCELGTVDWAPSGTKLNLRDYNEFPSFIALD